MAEWQPGDKVSRRQPWVASFFVAWLASSYRTNPPESEARGPVPRSAPIPRLLKVVVLGYGSALGIAQAENWPAWRGPRGDGTSLETNVPVHWSATSNLVWKTTIPGKGHASPIVFGDHLFTVSALPETQERVLVCLNSQTGKMLWNKTVLSSPLEKKHPSTVTPPAHPATDGELVYVAFLDREEMVGRGLRFSGHAAMARPPGRIQEHAWVLQLAHSLQRQSHRQWRS